MVWLVVEEVGLGDGYGLDVKLKVAGGLVYCEKYGYESSIFMSSSRTPLAHTLNIQACCSLLRLHRSSRRAPRVTSPW